MHSQASDFDSALEAISPDELRSFLREFPFELSQAARQRLQAALVERAAHPPNGWKPSAPPSQLAAAAEQFITAARQAGAADPLRLEELLREGTRAFLAGDMPTARDTLGPLLFALAEAEFELGQDETYDEVLTEDLGACARRFLVAVYMTTPLEERADALLTALDAIEPLAPILEPLRELEQQAPRPLPELDAFLPLWASALERKHPPRRDEWESSSDRHLREAVFRAEGTQGLERLAKLAPQPHALRAWCQALTKRGQWKEALHAFSEAASLVKSDLWRGEFLDGAALASHKLGHGDVSRRLAVAWRASPSLPRLLRWLEAGEPSLKTLRRRASSELSHPPTKASRLLGVLHLVSGDFQSAARLLAKAPGLGWSDSAHPGHVLFAAFSWLLGDAPKGSVRHHLIAPLSRPPPPLLGDEEPVLALLDDEFSELVLPTPPLLEVLQEAKLRDLLIPSTCQLLRHTLRQAARARVNGVLREKRRRTYAHAAQLVACCVELEHDAGQGDEVERWVAALQEETSRFSAFQAELQAALGRERGSRVSRR